MNNKKLNQIAFIINLSFHFKSTINMFVNKSIKRIIWRIHVILTRTKVVHKNVSQGFIKFK